MQITNMLSKFSDDALYLCTDKELFDYLMKHKIPPITQNNKGWYYNKTKKFSKCLEDYGK
jgi:hypothetical protein